MNKKIKKIMNKKNVNITNHNIIWGSTKNGLKEVNTSDITIISKKN